MSDRYLYEATLKPEYDIEPVTDNKMLFVQDQQGNSYNGQIIFDSSQISNSGHWIAWSEAYIEIPFVMSLKSSVDVTAATRNAFQLGLKNGYYQIIDSMQVDYNNSNIIQQQTFLNMYVNYKVLSTWSSNDLLKYGAICGVNPDSPGSYSFIASTGANGDGYANNTNNQPAIGIANLAAPDSWNSGFQKRQRESTAWAAVASFGSVPTMVSVAAAKNVGKNFYGESSDAAAAKVYSYCVLATIRLKDICDFFDKCPLVKGAYMRITLNYNSNLSTVTYVAAGPTMVLTSNVQQYGHTQPLMIASSVASNGMNSIVTSTGGVLTVEGNVLRTAAMTATSPTSALTSCRLYVPAKILSPVYERDLLLASRYSKVKYNDIYSYAFSGVTSGSSFNQLISNGLENPKLLVLIPFANANSGVFASVTNPVYQSCFDSAPGTTTPLASLSQFQVQVGGVNVLTTYNQYDYSNFLDEVVQDGSLNGGACTGLSSGLISEYMWSTAYRFHVCNIGRRVPSEHGNAKSVIVQGVNNTAVTLDFICFVAYEKEMTIDISNGAIA